MGDRPPGIPGIPITFNSTAMPIHAVAPMDFKLLPAPCKELTKEQQRKLFVEAHGGKDAEADFESWWAAHEEVGSDE